MAIDLKKLAILMEDAENGDVAEMEALQQYLAAEGMSIEDAEQYRQASFEPTAETHSESRLLSKGKAADDKKETRDALPLKDIAGAFGVDLKKAEEDGELEQGELQDYLRSRGVFSRVEGESNEDYTNRMLNAFGELGLNFRNVEDRALVANSLGHYENMDAREAIKEEAGSGVGGFFTRIVAPRTFEKAERDIMEGDGDAEGYFNFIIDNAKELGLDLGENLAMTMGAPVTGVLKAIANSKKAQQAYKAFKKGKKVLDGRTNANKALKGAGTIAGVTADAAAVPYAFEGLDAIAIDDPESTRSEFDNGDALASTTVNVVAPRFIGRGAGRLKAMLGENSGKVGEAVDNIAKVIPEGASLKKYLEPYVINKAGKSEMVRQIPVVSSEAEEVQKKNERQEKKNQSKAEKYDKWSRGLAIPMPGDKDYEEFQKWLDNNRKGLARYL